MSRKEVFRLGVVVLPLTRKTETFINNGLFILSMENKIKQYVIGALALGMSLGAYVGNAQAESKPQYGFNKKGDLVKIHYSLFGGAWSEFAVPKHVVVWNLSHGNKLEKTLAEALKENPDLSKWDINGDGIIPISKNREFESFLKGSLSKGYELDLDKFAQMYNQMVGNGGGNRIGESAQGTGGSSPSNPTNPAGPDL